MISLGLFRLTSCNDNTQISSSEKHFNPRTHLLSVHTAIHLNNRQNGRPTYEGIDLERLLLVKQENKHTKIASNKLTIKPGMMNANPTSQGV